MSKNKIKTYFKSVLVYIGENIIKYPRLTTFLFRLQSNVDFFLFKITLFFFSLFFKSFFELTQDLKFLSVTYLFCLKENYFRVAKFAK